MIENDSAKHTLRFYILARRPLDMLKKWDTHSQPSHVYAE